MQAEYNIKEIEFLFGFCSSCARLHKNYFNFILKHVYKLKRKFNVTFKINVTKNCKTKIKLKIKYYLNICQHSNIHFKLCCLFHEINCLKKKKLYK